MTAFSSLTLPINTAAEAIDGLSPVENLEAKLQKLRSAHQKTLANKAARIEKKKQGLVKKIDALVKKGQPTETTKKMLEKVEEEQREEVATFEYEHYVPLSRMQTESEFESKSARTKALNTALNAATEATEEADSSGLMGLRGVVNKMREEGILTDKKKAKAKDKNKSVQDVLKLGSHLLK